LASQAKGRGFETRRPLFRPLWPHLHPEQFMVKDHTEEQAVYLGEWVLDAFRMLLASEPPM
jgi:hypothetical protein